MAQGRFVRAYVAYLGPCHERASSLGHLRIAATSRHHAAACLREMWALGKDDPNFFAVRMAEEAVERGLGHWKPRTKDAKYAFGTTSVDDWIGRIKSCDLIDRTLADIGEAV